MMRGGNLEGIALKRKTALLLVATTLGILLLVYSLNVGCNIGSVWFNEKATEPWHMNNYIVIDGQHAYVAFGLSSLVFGGLATGLALPVFSSKAKSRKYLLALAGFFFTAIILTGLGFNTLDFMLGIFYWTDMKEPPPVQVPIIGPVNAWNYYFYLFVVPLWMSGLILGIALSIHKLYNMKQSKENVARRIQRPRKIFRNKFIIQQ
jgi:hypothetical protein